MHLQRRVPGCVALATGLFVAGIARADLSGEFADALDLDPSFLTGVNGATDIAFAEDGRAVVTTKTGSITIRRVDGSKNVIQGTFPDLDTQSEKGLNGVVADPRMPNGFFFYADNGPSTPDKHQVYHGVLEDDDTLTVDLDPVVGEGVNDQDEGLEGPANHDGGGLFVYDDHLYVAVGDTGANATPPTNKYASCLNKGNGKILRVNLDGTIPDDNPLSSETMVTACDSTGSDWSMAAPDRRIYAWGLRNPFRFWVDSHTGRMWIGDVGETTREEISVSDPAESYTGQHFGYPFHEGTTDWSTSGGTLRLDKDCDQQFSPSRPCTAPVTDYENVGRNGANCVIGGLIPEGCGWTDAFGGTLYYWFADFGAGWVHAVEVTPDRSGVVSATQIEVGTFSSAGPAAIRQGPNGAVYMVNNREGSVYEIKPQDPSGDGCLSTGGEGGGPGGEGGSPEGGSPEGGSPSGEGGSPSGGGGSPSGGGGSPSGGGDSPGGGGGSPGGGTSSDTGGSPGGGSSGAKTDGSKDSGGCGCRVVGDGPGGGAGLVAGLALAGLALGRRRRRRRRR